MTLETLIARASPEADSPYELLVLIEQRVTLVDESHERISRALVSWVPRDLREHRPHHRLAVVHRQAHFAAESTWGPAAALRDALEQLVAALPVDD